MNIDIPASWWEMGICPIPLWYQTKRPKIFWKTWVNRLPSFNQVQYWFNARSNIGLLLNDGLTVIDFDEAWRYFVWRQDNKALAKTYTVQTGRGFHVYFNCSADRCVRTSSFVGGELKVSGYVLAPPSIHPDGAEYSVRTIAPIMRVDSWRDLGIEVRESTPAVSASPKRTGGSIIQKIKESYDICEWLESITKVFYERNRVLAVCPFHPDTSPSLQIYPFENCAYCFSERCLAHRRTDIINMFAWYWQVTNEQAISQLAATLL